MKNRYSFVAVCCVMLLSLFSCVKVPDGILDEKQMEDILYEIHLSEGLEDVMIEDYVSRQKKEILKKGVFAKYKITPEQFDSSLMWYGRNLELYVDVYRKVIKRLEDENERVKKMVEADEMQTLSMRGDTVDIWKKGRTYEFMPTSAYNILPFSVATDENFQFMDKFVLGVHVRMMPDMSEHPRILIALENVDSTFLYKSEPILRNGWTEVELKSDTAVFFRNVFGDIYFPTDRLAPDQRIIVDSIRLMRIHPK
ncbi:MAG TPA: DUF4296 domain-containing protein [Candidatus Gallibacteroides avistercoris]|uniref:DUF4296 domain-containing protein n=1 Tax=Candidatus Gallibacteroides avistercoris TaxID=2840833 RepID=A0A9D1SBN0_9BACT|nr:DUF4296 domain-containing protein [Candidatus Gallibacteroides avistercoris]